jgi:hypothetical protein
MPGYSPLVEPEMDCIIGISNCPQDRNPSNGIVSLRRSIYHSSKGKGKANMNFKEKEIIQPILDNALSGINAVMSHGIKAAGLDPWKAVLTESITLGKIDLPIGKAKAKLEASINEVTGLSSLEIDSLTVESANLELLRESDVSLSWKCALHSELTAQLGGTVSATLGNLSPSVGLDGSASITGLTGTGEATGGVKAQLSFKTPFCVTGFEVSSVSVSYEDVIVKVDGLGELNDILQHVIHAVQEMVGRTITVKVPPAIQRAVRDAVKGSLPLCP